ncbi:MAG: hypothetical protein ACXAC5_03110 [Promethearchaeota archaeon]
MEFDASPYVGIIGSIVMWFGLIFTLLVIKGFIVQGTAMAISEWLLKIADEDSQERVCRWLGDKQMILQRLKEIKARQEN